MIPADLSRCFTHASRARGEQYVAGRRIHLAPPEPLVVRAVARGTVAWLVTLDARDGLLRMTCSCPFAEDRGFCKHLWGTLRIADNQGLLKPLLEAAGGAFIESSGSDELAAEDPELDLVELDALLYPDEEREGVGNTKAAARTPAKTPEPPWRSVLEIVRRNAQYEPPLRPTSEWPSDRRLIYLADAAASKTADGLVIELATEKRGRDGAWMAPKRLRSGIGAWLAIPDAVDREIGQMLRGVRRTNDWVQADSVSGFLLSPATFDTVLRLMSETGRLRIRREPQERPLEAAHWDAGPPWQIRYVVERAREPGAVTLFATLERAGETMPFDRALIIHRSGFLVHEHTIALVDIGGPFALVAELRQHGPITLSENDLPAAVGALLDLPRAPRLALDDGLTVRE